MSNPTGRSFSPAWALLLLPIGLLAGWLIGELPSPPARLPERTNSPGEAVASAPPSGTRFAPRAEPRPEPPQRQEAEYSEWTSLDNAVAESRRNGKPVLIDFNADWCPPCQRLKREVFEDGSRGRAIQEAVIPVSIVDRVRENGSNPQEIEDLQRRFQVDAFPTLIVYSPGNGRTQRKQGYGGADAMVEWIVRAAESVR
jgi:thiol:disulfide interchange protein